MTLLVVGCHSTNHLVVGCRYKNHLVVDCRSTNRLAADCLTTILLVVDHRSIHRLHQWAQDLVEDYCHTFDICPVCLQDL